VFALLPFRSPDRPSLTDFLSSAAGEAWRVWNADREIRSRGPPRLPQPAGPAEVGDGPSQWQGLLNRRHLSAGLQNGLSDLSKAGSASRWLL